MPNQSVLIVDDEPIVRDSIRDWLKEAGYVVSTAEDAEGALKLIEKQDFSVMILDIRLPGQSGIAVLKQVKALRPWLKSIIITAYPSEETVSEAKALGAIDYMIKPLAPDDLEKLVRQTLDSIGPEPTITTAVKVKPKAVAKAPGIEKSVTISKTKFKTLVNELFKTMEVTGPRAKHGKYVFDKVNSFEEIALDFDVAVNPPTRFFIPAKEVLLKFHIGENKTFEPVVDNMLRALIGVHPYDITAMSMLDEVYMVQNPDPNYIARRINTLVIGLDCLNPSPNSFSPSMGSHIASEGFDLLLTDIGDRYIVTIGTKKGADLLDKYADPKPATVTEIGKRAEAREKALAKYKLTLDVPYERLPKLLEESYDDPYWETNSKPCFSCGSCIMVCPTCFCFDVRDEVSMNLKNGERFRVWDGCMLTDFAKVATGENFRADKTSRYRHRFFRKGKYILEKYGKVGCVGCGRCISACLVDIASPYKAFNAIAESYRAKQEATRIVSGVKTKKELYLPEKAELVEIKELTPKEKAFKFKFVDGRPLGQRPGQFVEVSIPGIGEAPISVSSSPTRGDTFQLAIRNVGDVTNAIHGLRKGAMVGVRGPFGNGFPLEYLAGKDIMFVAGGIGLFPLRSLVQYVMDKRSSFGKVILLFGARSPSERLFLDELDAWSKSPDLEFHETVDKGDEIWKGNVGVITTLIPKVEINPKKTVAVIVGPPIMYRFVIVELKKRDLADENIVMSLERRMKCGVGKCGHCQINGVYVCQEGPVFSLAQLRSLREAV